MPVKSSERPTKAGVVESCSLLNGLSATDKGRVIEESFTAFAARGETIWLAGWPAEYACIVGEGFVKMTKSTPKGSEAVMEILGPGQAFGLLAAIEGRGFPLNAIAATDVWYLKVPARVMTAVYERSDALKDHIIRHVGPRLRKAHDMMGRLASGKVENRLAAVLLILASTYAESSPDGLTLSVPLTRQDLAEMSGTTVETAIRVMSRWQKDRLVLTEHQRITIVDQSSLESMLNS